jgi:excisionase family DNA binding protein
LATLALLRRLLLIGCSRQQVVDLIDEKKLKGTKVGTHRRVQLSDVLAFIEQEDVERDQASVKQLVDQSINNFSSQGKV